MDRFLSFFKSANKDIQDSNLNQDPKLDTQNISDQQIFTFFENLTNLNFKQVSINISTKNCYTTPLPLINTYTKYRLIPSLNLFLVASARQIRFYNLESFRLEAYYITPFKIKDSQLADIYHREGVPFVWILHKDGSCMKLEILKSDDGLQDLQLVRQKSKRYQKFNSAIGHIKGASFRVTLIDYIPVYSDLNDNVQSSAIISNHLGKRYIAVKNRGKQWGISSFTKWVCRLDRLVSAKERLENGIKRLKIEKEAEDGKVDVTGMEITENQAMIDELADEKQLKAVFGHDGDVVNFSTDVNRMVLVEGEDRNGQDGVDGLQALESESQSKEIQNITENGLEEEASSIFTQNTTNTFSDTTTTNQQSNEQVGMEPNLEDEIVIFTSGGNAHRIDENYAAHTEDEENNEEGEEEWNTEEDIEEEEGTVPEDDEEEESLDECKALELKLRVVDQFIKQEKKKKNKLRLKSILMSKLSYLKHDYIMHTFQDWIIFTGVANIVLIKYNSKMMRITKVVNLTGNNMKDVCKNEASTNQEEEQRQHRFRQFRMLINNFQPNEGDDELFNQFPFIAMEGMRENNDFSLVVRKFGYIKALDMLVIPLVSGIFVKITNLNTNPQACYTRETTKPRIYNPIGGIFQSLDMEFLEQEYGITDPLQKPFFSIGSRDKYSLVNPVTMKLVGENSTQLSLKNIHPSVYQDFEDFTAEIEEPNTCILVGGDDLVKYNLKSEKTVGVLPHALIKDRIYYSTFQPFQQAKFSDQLMSNSSITKQDVIIMGGNDLNTVYVFAVVESSNGNNDAARGQGGIFECRSKILTTGHEQLEYSSILTVKVVRGGKAYNFRSSKVNQGEHILQNNSNINEEDNALVTKFDFYLVILELTGNVKWLYLEYYPDWTFKKMHPLDLIDISRKLGQGSIFNRDFSKIKINFVQNIHPDVTYDELVEDNNDQNKLAQATKELFSILFEEKSDGCYSSQILVIMYAIETRFYVTETIELVNDLDVSDSLRSHVLVFKSGDDLSILRQMMQLYGVDSELSSEKAYIIVSSLTGKKNLEQDSRFILSIVECNFQNLGDDKNPEIDGKVLNMLYSFSISNKQLQTDFTQDIIFSKYISNLYDKYPEQMNAIQKEDLIKLVCRDVINPVYNTEGELEAITFLYRIKSHLPQQKAEINTHIMIKRTYEQEQTDQIRSPNTSYLTSKILVFSNFILNPLLQTYYRSYCSREKVFMLLSDIVESFSEHDEYTVQQQDEPSQDFEDDNSESDNQILSEKNGKNYYLMDVEDLSLTKITGSTQLRATHDLIQNNLKQDPNIRGENDYYWNRNSGLFDFLDFNKILG